MCGVLVWISKNRKISPAHFSDALKLLYHRGPDAQRMIFFHSPDGTQRFSTHSLDEALQETPQMIAVGHTRLSIIDPRAVSHQPFVSDDGRYCLVYNGEIYNYIEERERLGLVEVCRTSSDTEVLFRALIKEGLSCLRRLNGMWAFAFFDFENREMHLSRDRYGKKPLFIYCDGENFIAASEIKSIYSILGTRRRIDKYTMSGFLIGKLTPTFDDGRTMYEGIRFLPPGSNLRLNLVSLRFDITRANGLEAWWSEEAAPENFSEDVERAVMLRLRSDVPIAIPVSGGVDSTIIAAYAARNAVADNLVSFYTVRNLDRDGKPGPDLEYARRLSRQLNVPLKEIDLTMDSDTVYSDFLQMTRQTEFPINPFLISYSTYLMNKRMAEDGIKVLLDGTGGDEVLGGYPSAYSILSQNLAVQ